MKRYVYSDSFKENDTVFFPAYVLKLTRHAKFSLALLRFKSRLVTAALRREVCKNDISLFREGDFVEVRCVARREYHAQNGVELNVTEFKTLSSPTKDCDGDTKTADKIRRLLNGEFNDVCVCRDALCCGIRGFMRQNGFIEVTTPLIAESDTQGLALDFFGKGAHLAASAQPMLTPYTAIFERVYEITHLLSAKRRGSPQYMNEITAVSLQMGYIEDLDDITAVVSQMLTYAMRTAGEKLCVPEIGDAYVITLSDALSKIGAPSASDINPAQARKLCEDVKADLVFVRDFPNRGRHFYARERDGVVQRFDLYFRGIKICSGSENICSGTELGETAKDYAAYREAVLNGIMPHGGAELYLERLVEATLGLSNVRLATVFPRDTRTLSP